MSKKVVILGAGIAGLGAGWRISDRDYEVTVIEKEPRIGGLAASIREQGYTFDFGPHAFHSQNQSLLSIFHKIMEGNEIVKQKKWVQIKFQKKYFEYPLKPANILFQLRPSLALKCTLDLLWARFRNLVLRLPDDSTRSWLVNRFGKSIYDIFFGSYTQKVWGVSPRDLSASFIAGRVPAIKIRELIFRYVFPNNNFVSRNSHEVPWDLDIYYPAGGASVFPEMMLKQIMVYGGKLILNSIPKKIIVEDNKVRGLVLIKDEGELHLDCDHLISTIPVNELAELLGIFDESDMSNLVKRLKFRAIIIVCLKINKPSVFKPQTVYFTNRIFNRIAQMNNYSKRTAPNGKSGITAEIMCDVNDEIWNEPEEKLCSRVIADLVEEGCIERRDVEGVFVLKNRCGYPILLKGYEDSLGFIFQKLSEVENLLTGGRQGLFNYVQMDYALHSGLKMAEHIISNNSKRSLEERPLNVTYFK